MVSIYTDGSSRGNPGPGGWGAIIDNGEKVVEIGGREEHSTNNRMELTAAIKSLEAVSGDEITIYTDSEYLMKGITEWVYNWQERGWKTAAKKPVLNQDLWQKLLVASSGKDIKWSYVAGHSGHRQNDRCDEIATAFADNLAPNLYEGSRESYRYN